jgi:hypothetical protein
VVERASARPIASSSGSSSNGLNRTATASECAASERVLASVRPVIKIAGRPRPRPLRASHISIPVISGISMSTTIHALDRGVSLASNSDGLAKVLTRNPEAETSLFSERSNDGSSSTTSTVAGLIVRTALVARSLDLTLLEVFADGLTAAAFLARFVMILISRIAPRLDCVTNE